MRNKRRKKITALQKLRKRLATQFKSKKFIGDIEINDEEYDLLLDDFKNKYERIIQSDSHEIRDIMFAVALVHIGIREYDTGYWPYLATILEVRSIPGNQQRWIGNSFISTLKYYNKFYLDECSASYGIIGNILMHSFVTNNQAYKFFDFLYKFYELDLERDISRNTKEVMEALCEAIMSNDNRNRTYLIQQHVSDALKVNPRGAKIRIRRYLRLIDKYFWNDFTYPKSNNRIVNLLYKWMEESEEYSKNYSAVRKGGYGGGKKCFISPYLNYNFHDRKFYIVMPPALLMDKSLNRNDSPQWRVKIQDEIFTKAVDLEEVTLGCKTFEVDMQMKNYLIFEKITIELCNWDKSKIYKFYTIEKDDIRFFNTDGVNIRKNVLQKGHVLAFAKKDFYVKSEALKGKESYGEMEFYDFEFEDGDILRFENNKAITIGRKISEGVTLRGCITDVYAETEESKIPVYRLAPSFIIKTLPSRIGGSFISINNKKYKLTDLCLEEVENIRIMGERYYLFTLKESDFKFLNSVIIDIPNDNKRRVWDFAYIKGFNFEFENAPYVFKRRGSIKFSQRVKMDRKEIRIEQIGNENIYNFQLNDEVDCLKCSIPGEKEKVALRIPIPKFSWRRGNKEKWKIDMPEDIWYTDLPTSLQIKCIADDFYLIINENDEDEIKVKYSKMKETSIFNCDLTRFKSYLDRDSICKNINIVIGEESYPFLRVITRSYVANSVFYADYEKNLIIGNLDILGRNEYFVDIKYNQEIVAEKIPVISGKVQCAAELKNGDYQIIAYEGEEDEFGFDTVMFPIKTQIVKLINPLNLTNASLRILRIASSDGKVKLDLAKYNYLISNIESIDKKNYEGLMIYERNDKIFYTRKVKITFPNLNEVNKAYISFIEGGDELEYIYDSKECVIVENEEKGISKSECYRRYEFSLYPEEFIYFIEFTEINSQIISWAHVYESNKGFKKNEIKSSSMFDFGWKDEKRVSRYGNKDIKELDFSIRTFNCLDRSGFKFVNDIIRFCNSTDLLRVRNLGKSGKEEIYNKLDSLGIYLRKWS